jgi:hypothetical protein
LTVPSFPREVLRVSARLFVGAENFQAAAFPSFPAMRYRTEKRQKQNCQRRFSFHSATPAFIELKPANYQLPDILR